MGAAGQILPGGLTRTAENQIAATIFIAVCFRNREAKPVERYNRQGIDRSWLRVYKYKYKASRRIRKGINENSNYGKYSKNNN